jgi:hypothetical protein
MLRNQIMCFGLLTGAQMFHILTSAHDRARNEAKAMKRHPVYVRRRRIAALAVFTAIMLPIALVDGCAPDPITDNTPQVPLTLP